MNFSLLKHLWNVGLSQITAREKSPFSNDIKCLLVCATLRTAVHDFNTDKRIYVTVCEY